MCVCVHACLHSLSVLVERGGDKFILNKEEVGAARVLSTPSSGCFAFKVRSGPPSPSLSFYPSHRMRINHSRS